METATRIRVLWTGRPTGHAQWPSKIVIVDNEAAAREMVAAPMKAPYNRVAAHLDMGNWWKLIVQRRR